MGGNGSANGRENRDDNRDGGGGEKKPGSEDAKRRATPTSNQQPQPQDPTPQQDGRIILKTRAQGREGQDWGGRRRGEEAQKKQRNCRRDVGNGGDLGGKS